MLAEFALWWVSQMRSLAPGFLAPSGRREDALIIAFDGPATGFEKQLSGTLVLRREGRESGLRALDLTRPLPSGLAPHLATGLRLPRGAMLCHDVVLPLAAARDLPAVLGFEMDRLTPFSADEVYWSVSGLTFDRARAKLSLTLSIVLRAQVDALRTALARINVAPSFVEADIQAGFKAGSRAETGRISLTTPGRQPGQRLRQSLLVLCGVLALACLVTPFLRQQIALDAATQDIAAALPAANRAQALRQQLTAAAQGRTAIAQARHAGDALQVLATLTAALPDGTWLSDLTLKSGDLTFDGQSSNAAQLITLLSAVPGLRAPSFTAPVTRTADGKADLFSMHVTVAE
jgi:general secretion pathway protein L